MDCIKLILILLSVSIAAAIADPLQQLEDHKDVTKVESARRRFQLPKLFDFGLFKAKFAKKYNSVLEEIARRRVFLGHAFRAFVSGARYKLGLDSMYLKVNQMSDWTPEEVQSMTNAKRVEKSPPAATLEDVKEELNEIVLNRGESRLYDEIARELKNDVATSSSEAILEERQTTKTSPIEASRLASILSKVPGSGFVSQVVNGAMSYMSPGEEAKSEDAKPEESSAKVVVPRSDLPDEVFVDHSSSGCLLQVRDQGLCGSCYSFSTVALIEYVQCKQTGRLEAFSEQFMVSCGINKNLGISGCNGSQSGPHGAFFTELFGVERRSVFPYESRNGTCPYKNDTNIDTIGFYKTTTPLLSVVDFDQFDELLERTPIIVSITTYPYFNQYGGGIDTGEAPADQSPFESKHAVVIVGHGREDGYEYYLIRNSYGWYWGEQGLYKVVKSSPIFYDKLGFVSEAFLKSEPVLKRNPKYDSEFAKKIITNGMLNNINRITNDDLNERGGKDPRL